MNYFRTPRHNSFSQWLLSASSSTYTYNTINTALSSNIQHTQRSAVLFKWSASPRWTISWGKKSVQNAHERTQYNLKQHILYTRVRAHFAFPPEIPIHFGIKIQEKKKIAFALNLHRFKLPKSISKWSSGATSRITLELNCRKPQLPFR